MERYALTSELLTKSIADGLITEKQFIAPLDSQSQLTISGFYYISMNRSNGEVEGLYYDPKSTPYQHLSLKSDQKSKTFAACGSL